jgi:hypothetical protein
LPFPAKIVLVKNKNLKISHTAYFSLCCFPRQLDGQSNTLETMKNFVPAQNKFGMFIRSRGRVVDGCWLQVDQKLKRRKTPLETNMEGQIGD